jgi:hypothetical protein
MEPLLEACPQCTLARQALGQLLRLTSLDQSDVRCAIKTPLLEQWGALQSLEPKIFCPRCNDRGQIPTALGEQILSLMRAVAEQPATKELSIPF